MLSVNITTLNLLYYEEKIVRQNHEETLFLKMEVTVFMTPYTGEQYVNGWEQ